MSHSPPSPPFVLSRRSGPASRLGLVAVAAGLAVVFLIGYGRWKSERAALIERLDGERHLAARERVERETVPHHARLAVARALVYDVLDTASLPADDPESELGRRAARLPEAQQLARRALAAQPNSWQAAMLLGAAIYLERSIAHDRRLYTEAAAWEEPLRKAVREASGKAEPRRFLVAAYLEVWPNLSAEKRSRARELLAETLRDDPEATPRLLPAWLEVADDVDSAFAPIPDRPDSWRQLTQIYGRAKRWEPYCRAHERYLASLFNHLERRLEEAERRLALGDLYNSRSLFLQVVVEAPTDTRFASLVERALRQYPPGLHGLRSTEAIESWLEFTLEIAELGIEILPPQIVSRLAGAATDLEPPMAARAALIGGEIHHAERLEKLTDSLRTEAWAPYLLTKARRLLERDELRPASSALDLAERFSDRRMSYWLLRERLARAQGDLVDLAEAEARLKAFRSREWSEEIWRRNGKRMLLVLLPEIAGRGLEIEMRETPAEGAVVQVLWDGGTEALLPIREPGRIALKFAIEPSLHQLELRVLAGGYITPGAVALVASSGL